MSLLKGKVALITGGGTGIGKSIAEHLLEAGAKVVVTGRREAPLQALQRSFPEKLAYIQADVSKAGDPKRAVAFAVETFGRLDILVNNAGALLQGPLVEATDEAIAHVLQVNVAGVAAFSREAVPFLSQTKGNIINISSIVGTAVFPGASIYSASKAAVDHLTRLLAAELGPLGIRVNTVSPGMTRTDMSSGLLSQEGMEQGISQQTPLGRIGEVQDIARAALFLASPDAGWVTGQILASSGGLFL